MISNGPTVGLDDIAKKTGVAVSTVSRALRDLPGIHPDTRTKVLREAELLGYSSRSRKSEKSAPDPRHRHILILTVGEETPSSYMAGLSRAALHLNISLHFHHANRSESNDLLSPRHLPLCLRQEMITGIVLVYRWPEKIVEKISRKLPTVSIVHTYQETSMDVLGIDHSGGMFSLVEHLKSSGHQQIGFVGMDPQVSWSRSRYAGYLEALLAMHLPISRDNLVQLNLDTLNEEIDRMAERVVAGMANGVRAWICADDFIGYDLCAELIRRGVRIPQDVAVTGFHRHPHLKPRNLPLLTSTEVDSELMGFNALQQLVYRISHPKSLPQLILMPATFFQGQSTHSL
jgi:DNA-binding LacI/PurR family transcriptional regulator